ncbi:MAG: hydroxymethylglutaryl-CoA lyase [Sphingobacteriaceae bacterium]|nr:hydroxymethylglutaryl-CoA lyase [Sphingobacteriaceae bacterium]
MLKITECPRDAMQGIKQQIPTELKIEYITQLLKVGFDTIDFGSFVSPKSIPQMQDTADVLNGIDLSAGNSKLLAIVANKRGAEDACDFEEISYLGFPFSISETFQQRNTNSSIEESVKRVEEIHRLCRKHKKELVVYISMAFGNPYNDPYSTDLVIDWSRRLEKIGIKNISLADTIGTSTPENIKELFSSVIPDLRNVKIGAHLHSTRETAAEKIKAAHQAGCTQFDVAIHGFGGCPMAKDELTGNISTQKLVKFAEAEKIGLNLNREELEKAYALGWKIFNEYH